MTEFHIGLGFQIFFGALGFACGLYLVFKTINEILTSDAFRDTFTVKFIVGILICLCSGGVAIRAIILAANHYP